jgi:uncharacterized damage-inducible protein DinB
MMEEIRRGSDQLRRTLEGEAWHGAALDELLEGVTAIQAATHPVPAAHSIWELVLHLITWQDVARRRIGGEAFSPDRQTDWPPVADTSPEAWAAARRALGESMAALQRTLSGLDEAAWLSTVPGQDYTVHFMVLGVVQHNVYHAGQVALLKKMV